MALILSMMLYARPNASKQQSFVNFDGGGYGGGDNDANGSTETLTTTTTTRDLSSRPSSLEHKPNSTYVQNVTRAHENLQRAHP
eukprot:scaffold517764_cov37-Prasinocladus_malaysianus.AAC.1